MATVLTLDNTEKTAVEGTYNTWREIRPVQIDTGEWILPSGIDSETDYISVSTALAALSSTSYTQDPPVWGWSEDQPFDEAVVDGSDNGIRFYN